MKAKPIAIALLAAAALAPAIAHASDALERAEEACENYDWPEALAWFGAAAEADDARAQQIAGLMHLYGERLYPGVERDFERARAWLERARAAGSIEATYMLARLERDPWLDPARLIASGGVRPPQR